MTPPDNKNLDWLKKLFAEYAKEIDPWATLPENADWYINQIAARLAAAEDAARIDELEKLKQKQVDYYKAGYVVMASDIDQAIAALQGGNTDV